MTKIITNESFDKIADAIEHWVYEECGGECSGHEIIQIMGEIFAVLDVEKERT